MFNKIFFRNKISLSLIILLFFISSACDMPDSPKDSSSTAIINNELTFDENAEHSIQISQDGTIIESVTGEYNFGEIRRNYSSVWVVFTITNIGTEPISILNFSLFGENSAYFFLNTNPASVPISPGSSTTFYISFKPQEIPEVTNKVLIYYNENMDNPYVINVKGKGLPIWERYGTLNSETNKSIDVHNGIIYKAYRDFETTKLRVVKHNGSVWEAVGEEYISDDIISTFISIKIDKGIPYVAYYENTDQGYELKVKKYFKNNWINLGSSKLYTAGNYINSFDVSNSIPYIAFRDSKNYNKATVMKFDNNKWQIIGYPGFSSGEANYLSLYVDNNTPYLAYQDYGHSTKATVMKFTGRYWLNAGNAGLSAGPARYLSLYVDQGIPYLAYTDYANSYKATVMKLENNLWIPVGNPGFNARSILFPSLYVDQGIPYLSFVDYNTNYVYRSLLCRYNGNNWEYIRNINDQVYFSGGSDTIRYNESMLIVKEGIPYSSIMIRYNSNGALGSYIYKYE